IVMYNTNYAQRIINKQFESNRALEEAKNRAEHESTSKTEFLANISHELRTPLNAIIGFSEIIMAETYGKMENRQYKDYIADINGSGKHLLSVINDILDFSKASANKLNVDKMELDLNKLAAASMRFVKPRADSASVQLIEDMPKHHIIIYADPKRLKQALLNLLSNSVKFTPTDGSVTLSIKRDKIKKLVYIAVTDTGIGMSDQDIPKALSSFGQVDNTLSRKYEGTGLGLPLTKKLIELMDGKFDIQSTPGEGTTVTITFEYSESIEL
ncbi:MAG: HAMP domain-containing histidine kinase, partial [Rickettsiaceae bacterium]|nr:HAMP domain-containing histidine kinase [Rickettsiaceae bacterium]